MTETYTRIAVDKIQPSPFQYRRTFGGTEDDELVDSIKAHGVLQPIRVRANGSPETYELIFGERRWRCSKKAGLADVPAIVVEASDDQVIEELLVENLKRRGVHPIEEGEHFKRLITDHGYTAERIRDRTGKSLASIYARMKLCDLVPAARKACLSGRLPVSHAELLARLPLPKLQEQALDDALGGDRDFEAVDRMHAVGVSPEEVSLDGNSTRHSGATVQPLSFRAFQALIHRRYATRLELAKFPVADTMLVPEAGACTTCPHRSGYQAEEQPSLFPDLTDPADVCTNPPCFERKTAAVWEQAKADAKARAVEVVEGADAKDVFGYDGRTAFRAPYVDPDEELPHELQKVPGGKSQWGKMLGKRLADVPVVLVQDPSGAPREMIDKKKALEILRETGKVTAPPAKSGSGAAASGAAGADRPSKDDRDREAAKRALKEGTLARVLEQVSDAWAEAPSDKKLTAWLRWIAVVVARELALSGTEGAERALQRHDVETFDGYESEIESAKEPESVLGLLVELLVATVGDGFVSGWGDKRAKELFDEAVRLAGVDVDKAQAFAKEAAKAEAQVDAAKEKKTPARKKGAR